MTIQEWHYDFKTKLNKIDSQSYRNLRIQEIDWVLNEACEIFIKTIAEPRYRSQLGIEVNQRIIDDIKEVVKDGTIIPTTPFGDTLTYVAPYPTDYWFHLSSFALASKSTCTGVVLKTTKRQHDDQHEQSPFDNSNFEWRETNFTFTNQGFRLYTDGTFSIDNFVLNYTFRPPYMHNAAGTPSQTYTLPSGVVLTGTQDCILSPGTHREIVDIAVLVTTGNLQIPDYQVKLAKVKSND